MLLNHCCPQVYVLPSDAWDSFIPLLIIGIVSSVVGFAGAYLLFRKSTQFEKNKILDIENKESRDFLNFLKFYLERIFLPAQRLAFTFHTLTVDLKERSLKDQMPNYDPSFNFKWFYDIDKTKLLKSFLKNFPGTTHEKAYYYNQLLSRIDLMDNIVNRFLSDFESYITVGQKFQEMFNEHQLRIQKLIDPVIAKIILNNGDLTKLTDRERDFVEAIKNWQQKPDADKRNMFVTFETLISEPKLHRFVVINKDEELLDALRKTTFAFKSYEQNRNIHIHVYSSFTRSINHSISRLKVIVRKMNKVL